jgi:GAF domain-containing protein
MPIDRRVRLWRLVVEQAHGGPVTIQHVCAAMVAVTAVDGAAVTVTLPAGLRETVYASGRTAADLAELALTVGEGPSLVAAGGGPVLVADLASRESLAQWPAFAAAADAMGVRAIFALPLQVGGVRLGVIDLHRGRSGQLSREQVECALLLADTACALLIDSADESIPVPAGREPEQARLQHPEVHQATGMIIVQLGASAAVALVRLRAYAYAHDRRLRDVAREVVARRLRFDPDEPGDDSP